MPNQYNDLFDGLLNGLQSVGGGIIKHKIQNDAFDLFSTAKDNLLNYYAPVQQEQVQERNISQPNITGVGAKGFPIIEQNEDNLKYDKSAYNNSQIDNRKQQDLFDFIDARGQLGQFGDTGQSYVNTLDTYQKLNQKEEPQFEFREVNGELVKVNKKTGETTKVYGEPKKDFQYDMGKPYLTSKDGKFFMQYPSIEKGSGKTAFSEPIEINEELYNDYKSDKWLTAQQKSDITLDRQQQMIGFKLDLGLGKSGSKGNGAMTFDINKAEDFSRLKKFNELSRDYANIKNDDKKLAEYQALQKELTGKLNLDWQGLNGVVEKVGNMTDKQAKQFFKQLTEGKVDVKSNVQKQAEDIQTAFNQLKESYSGQELINQLLNYFEQIKGAIDPYVMGQIKEQLKKNYGVTLQ